MSDFPTWSSDLLHGATQTCPLSIHQIKNHTTVPACFIESTSLCANFVLLLTANGSCTFYDVFIQSFHSSIRNQLRTSLRSLFHHKQPFTLIIMIIITVIIMYMSCPASCMSYPGTSPHLNVPDNLLLRSSCVKGKLHFPDFFLCITSTPLHVDRNIVLYI